MKTLIKILELILIVLVVVTITSCRKCADCTTTVTTKVTGQQPTTGTSVSEYCGDNLKEIDGNVTTSTSTYQGVTATVTSTTHCK